MKRPLTLRLAVGLLLCPALAMAGAPASQAAPDDLNYYYSYFDVGAQVLPHTDTDWVPQGIAADTSADTLIVSYYDSNETKNSILDIIDRTTRARVKTLRLDFVGHVSGVAITSKYLWITRNYGTSEYVVRYDRSVLNQADYSTIATLKRFPVKANSYACSDGDGDLWVGHFDPDHRSWMYRYTVSSTGQLTYAEDRYTPSKAQGCVVTSSRLIWSQSYGRDNRSNLIVWPRHLAYDGNWDIGRLVTAPNMSEGLTYAGGRVYVVYESGSDEYDGTNSSNAASYIIRSVHDGSIPPLPSGSVPVSVPGRGN